jgi:type I restriction enzyme S subunit
MEHLEPGELNIQRWSSVEDGTTFTRRVTPGQTLFGKRRAYQRKVAFAEFDAICSGDILTFQADETQMLSSFLPFLVQSNRFFDHALGTSAGSLSPRTNWRDLSRYQFDLPPLDEQKRIADLLWAVERHRGELVGRASATTRALQRFLGDAFGTAAGPSVAIVDLCTEVVGGVWGSPEGEDEFDVLALGPRVYAPGTTDFVTDGSPVRSVSKRQAESRLVRADDIILERSGGSPTQPVGRVVIAGLGLPPCIPTDFQRLLRPDRERVEPRYLFWRLRHDWVAGITRDYSKKTTNITNLSVKDYIARQIPVPTLAAQEVLLSEVNAFEIAISAAATELSDLRTLRSSIFTDIFGGN